MDPGWKTFLSNREDGDVSDENLKSARHLLNHQYEEGELPERQANPTKDKREVARYEAEWKYFERSETQADVEKLLKKIVHQRYMRYRYRDPKSTEVDLQNIPSRRIIAAERLYQRKLIKLSGYPQKKTIQTGLDTLGSKEQYVVSSAGTEGSKTIIVTQYPQFEQLGGQPPILGHKVQNVKEYRYDNDEQDIVDQFEHVLRKCLDNDNRLLVQIFREMCLTQNATFPQSVTIMKTQIVTNCFQILTSEQSQFHSAYFFEGDMWKLGMAVSFARLIRLFEDRHVTLHEIFNKYALYSNVELMKCFDTCRENCNKIDDLYQEKYPCLVLDEAQAMRDLGYLYGDYDEIGQLENEQKKLQKELEELKMQFEEMQDSFEDRISAVERELQEL